MANDKDFKVKNGIKPTAYHEAVGTVTSGSAAYSIAGASYDGVSFSVVSQDTSARSVRFKPDGTKMFMLGADSDSVHQYTLSTAWDLSTASYDSVSFSVAAKDTTAMKIVFKPDGTEMYMCGAVNNSIHQYNLSTAWDITTASFDSTLSFTAQDAAMYSVAFKSDGTKMYAIGIGNDAIYQYSLSTAWDLSTASYDSVSFSVAAQDTNPVDIVFNPDGDVIYLLGLINDTIYQYDLATAWDLSTASYSGISFNVTSQMTGPYGLDLKSDGTKMYVVDVAGDVIYQYSTVITTNILDLSTGSVFELTPTSDIQVTLSNPAASGTVSGATLLLDGAGVSSYLDNASYASKLKTVATEDTNPFGLSFSTDGTKMYIGGVSLEAIYQYTLSTAWDVSTATYDTSFSTLSQAQQPRGVAFKNDGTVMYVLLSTTDGIYQYSLSTAWEISTASYASKSLIVTSQDTTPEGIAFKPDGTKLYMCGATSDRVHQYTLSTAWDLSTATYDSKSFLFTGQFTNPTGISFSSDGSVVVALGDTSNVAYQYSLSTPWDISTATYNGVSFDFSSAGTTAKDIFLGDTDSSFYIVTTINVVAGGANDSVYQFNSGEANYIITYDTSIQWAGGTAPTSPALGDKDVLTFTTRDGGTTYNAAVAIDGAQ